jgi:hypothetical protein
MIKLAAPPAAGHTQFFVSRRAGTRRRERRFKVLATAQSPLHEEFSGKFADHKDWETSMIITALQRVAVLMTAEEIDASPVMHTGAGIETVTH